MSMQVAGPGPYSKRTDQAKAQLPNAGYGEQADFQAIQGGAPMSASPASPMPPVTPLSAPTQRPNEPITAGAPFGAGPGPASTGPSLAADTVALVKHLPILRAQAKDPNVSDSFRAFVRFIEGAVQ